MRFALLLIGFFTAAVTLAGETDESKDKYFPQKLTAQELLYYCAASALSSSGRNRQYYCSGFVSGVEESVRLLNANSRDANKNSICVPEGKPARHFRDVYIKHATKKTTDLERPAAMVVLEALESTFPCVK
ncbi:MAG: Rap1a/Tai family immunity protein [Gammaproteobacteria bacterium]